MGLIYKKKLGTPPYGNYTKEKLLREVNAVNTTGFSYQSAAYLYPIAKRTIWNNAKNKQEKIFGDRTPLSEVEERELVDVLLISAEFGSPLTIFDLRIIVKHYLDHAGRSVIKFANNFPGKDWCLNALSSYKDVPKENISNFDETNLSNDPSSIKCISRRGIKYQERLMNSTKSCISVLFVITGSMDVLPPYVVLRRSL